MNTRIFIAIATLVVSQFAQAQILNVDRPTNRVDTAGIFLGSIDFSYNVNNRSKTRDSKAIFKGLKSKADLVYISELHEYILINQFNYYSSTGSPFISTGYSHLRVNFLRERKLSYESFTQVQYDKGRNMPLRWLLGSGIRYRVINRPNNYMHFGVGIMREHERWTSLEDDQIELTPELWKVSSYLSTNTQLNDYVKLIFIGYYQGGYDSSIGDFRHRINTSASLVVTINKLLSLTTNVNYQYEDRPIIDINKQIYSVTNGLRLSF